jgi:hypothetical protein
MRTLLLMLLAGVVVTQAQSAPAAPVSPAQAAPATPATPSRPSAPAPPPSTGAGLGVTPQPVSTLSELMVTVLYPASDALFYISTRTPTTNTEWTTLQGQALMVAETANVLMLSGHARDKDQWMADAKLMREAFSEAFQAAKKKDVAAIEALNERMVASCSTCHRHYRRGYGRSPFPPR